MRKNSSMWEWGFCIFFHFSWFCFNFSVLFNSSSFFSSFYGVLLENVSFCIIFEFYHGFYFYLFFNFLILSGKIKYLHFPPTLFTKHYLFLVCFQYLLHKLAVFHSLSHYAEPVLRFVLSWKIFSLCNAVVFTL